ncbi:MAG: helix-turn-helix domain-containing protein [bacterium]|nr:helix-turn-helix domain-containing protein [bacterium]
MKLTIEETAKRLGKSPRQIRYRIKNGTLPARKVGGVWFIDSDALTLSAGQEESAQRKERQLRTAVEEGLGLTDPSERPPRYSVRDLKAFQIALPLYRKAVERISSEHPATGALRQVLQELSRGCHRFDRTAKADAYRDAREAASLAICELLIQGGQDADELVTAIEQELMATLAGLLRRLDRRRTR